jgi:hypothetical protein
MTKRDEILGRNIFDVFPDNPDDRETTSTGDLHASLMRLDKSPLDHPLRGRCEEDRCRRAWNKLKKPRLPRSSRESSANWANSQHECKRGFLKAKSMP